MPLSFADIEKWSAEEVRQRMAASPEAAAEILRLSAEAGVADAQALYGQILLDGRGVVADQVAALHWFSEAAQAGHVMAMNMVGRCCAHGWGTKPDNGLAAQWYKAAADRGLDWGLYNLASLYCLGDGVPVDREEALRLFRAAAAQGHVKSLNMIGGFYEDGWVVEKDMAIAADHYRQGAEAGDFRGQFNHARMLINAGRLQDAARWIAHIPETATPAFMAKATAWLSDHPDETVRSLARDLQRAAPQPL